MITKTYHSSYAVIRRMLSIPVALVAVAVTILACDKENRHADQLPKNTALAEAISRDRNEFEYKTTKGWVGFYKADGTMDSTWGEVTYRVPLKERR